MTSGTPRRKSSTTSLHPRGRKSRTPFPIWRITADGRPRVEIFHDVLAPAILAWRSTRNAARLEREKQAAEDRASADRRRARIFRATAVVSLVLLAGAIVAVILAQSETARAVRTQDVALSLKLAGDARSDLQDGVVD